MAELSKTLKDAAYVAIGFGVIGFQRAQVRRQDLLRELRVQRARLEDQAGGARGLISALIADLEERFEPVAGEIESRLDEIEERLPEQAKALFEQVREVAKDVQAQVRTRLANETAAA